MVGSLRVGNALRSFRNCQRVPLREKNRRCGNACSPQKISLRAPQKERSRTKENLPFARERLCFFSASQCGATPRIRCFFFATTRALSRRRSERSRRTVAATPVASETARKFPKKKRRVKRSLPINEKLMRGAKSAFRRRDFTSLDAPAVQNLCARERR